MNDDVLDLVFEEDTSALYNSADKKIGKRYKVTDYPTGKTEKVQYAGEYGENLGYAREVKPVFGDPYVEFCDRDGNVVGKAHVNVRNNGTREIRYTDTAGNLVSRRDVKEDVVKRNSKSDYWDAETRDPGSGSTSSGVSSDLGDGPAIYSGSLFGRFFRSIFSALFLVILPFLFLFVMGAVADLSASPLGRILGDPDGVLRIARLVSWGIVPLGVLLVLLQTKTRHELSPGARTIRIVHLVLAAITLGATAKLVQAVLTPGDWSISGWRGWLLYFRGYIPALVYALINRILRLFGRRSQKWGYRYVQERAGDTIVLTCAAVVFLARMTMVFLCRYTPDFADAMFFLFRMIGHAILAYACGSLLKIIVDD